MKRVSKGAIRLSIPAKVAYNADTFRKSVFNLLDELGCPKCFSGVDCYFTNIRDYLVNPSDLSVTPIEETANLAKPISFQGNTLNVGLSQETAYNIDKIEVALKDIFEEIGCLACCSGQDIFFQEQFERNF
ncbi:hypothetical protein [Maribacter sp. 2-571]|uniref:hypothetical protein n=1 Tax=Maribacter sp. 2-571 TaxID=3417569 RepID=UPI003D331175